MAAYESPHTFFSSAAATAQGPEGTGAGAVVNMLARKDEDGSTGAGAQGPAHAAATLVPSVLHCSRAAAYLSSASAFVMISSSSSWAMAANESPHSFFISTAAAAHREAAGSTAASIAPPPRRGIIVVYSRVLTSGCCWFHSPAETLPWGPWPRHEEWNV